MLWGASQHMLDLVLCWEETAHTFYILQKLLRGVVCRLAPVRFIHHTEQTLTNDIDVTLLACWAWGPCRMGRFKPESEPSKLFGRLGTVPV